MTHRDMLIEREPDETSDTDALVRADCEELIRKLEVYGRTVPPDRAWPKWRPRYAGMVQELREIMHDHLPGEPK